VTVLSDRATGVGYAKAFVTSHYFIQVGEFIGSLGLGAGLNMGLSFSLHLLSFPVGKPSVDDMPVMGGIAVGE
jgi:hypothetical protein